MHRQPVAVAAWCIVALTAAAADAQPLRDVFRRTNPSVVMVRTGPQAPAPSSGADGAPAGTEEIGSGVLVSADGKVVTAAHVVRVNEAIHVSFLDGAPIPATVVTMVPSADIALLQLERVPPGAVVATFGDSDAMETGDQVFTIGAPHGANHSLAVGWISARRQQTQVYEDATALEVFQTDLDVFAGNSGGPLFDLAGRVVGIVTHLLGSEGATSGPSFSVAGNVVKRLLLDERRTWFGVESFMLDGGVAEALNLPQPAGLLVQSVSPGSLAARLGVRGGTLPATVAGLPVLLGGDVLVEVMGLTVTGSDQFMTTFLAAIDKVKPGDAVSVRVWRGGQVVALQATVPRP